MTKTVVLHREELAARDACIEHLKRTKAAQTPPHLDTGRIDYLRNKVKRLETDNEKLEKRLTDREAHVKQIEHVSAQEQEALRLLHHENAQLEAVVDGLRIEIESQQNKSSNKRT